MLLPWTLFPELASDLDDSDNLLAGSAWAEEPSSPLVEVAWACEEKGRLASSKVTLCFHPAVSSGTLGIRSCTASLSFTSCGCVVLGSSPDRRRRAAKFIREGFFLGAKELNVGAVVMISGAAIACVSSKTKNRVLDQAMPNGDEKHTPRYRRRSLGCRVKFRLCSQLRV